MQDFLRWLASWKGIDVEPGTELRLELTAWPEGGLALLLLLGVSLAFIGVFWVYRRDGRNLGPWQRTTLAALRCLALLTLMIVVLEPNLVAVKKEERPGHTILLLDVSQSMQQIDAFRRAEVQPLAQGWRDVGVRDPAATSRLDLVKAVLGFEGQKLLGELAARNDIKIYGIGPGLEPIPLLPTAGEPEASGTARPAKLDLDAILADGRYTNLGGAVRAALERSREAAIAGLILITDGRRNVGPQGAEVARLLAQRKVPHTLVFGVGDPSETQTVELTRIEAPEKVFQKDPFRVSAHVATQGYDLTGLTVRLLRVASPGGAGEVIGTKQIQVGGDSPEALIEFDQLTSSEAGVYTYRVEVQPPSGEPIHPQRHVAHAQIEVLGEQTRVLLIAGGPSHEYRILRNALIRDQTFELRCWLSSADPKFPQDGNVSIEELPTDRRELDAIDVIIMLDPDSSKLTREFSELAAQHVLEDGAGLWWVCGEKFTLEAIRDTANTRALADLLPVVPDLVRADRRIIGFGHAFDRPWPYELTAEGRESKIVGLVDQKDANALLWPTLPGYHFAFPVLRAKPLATTLIKLTNPELARSQEAMPLVAMQFVGAGRVMFSGTDETYRWRSTFENYYNQFWVKGIRWLFEGRLNAGNSRLRIRVSEDKLELGESLTVAVDARDDSYGPLIREHMEMRLTRKGAPAETVQLDHVDGVPGSYQTTVRPTATGFYTLAPVTDVGRDVEASFQVVPAAVEREGPVDLAELKAIASAEGGELVSLPRDLLAAVDRIPSMKATDTFRTPHAIWDTWATVVLLVTVLALEWYLRKRFNLL